MSDCDTVTPTLREISELRERWLLAEDLEQLEIHETTREGVAVPVLVDKNGLWLRYQDALARRTDAQREKEVAATTELARTNTDLAGKQMWLAAAITATTIGQLFVAFLTYARGH